MTKQADKVRHPSHYTASSAGFKVECIMLTKRMGFAPGNAVKYIWRHRDKGTPLEDLRKSEQYLEWCEAEKLMPHCGISQTRLERMAGNIIGTSDVADAPGVYAVIPMICHGLYAPGLRVLRGEIRRLEAAQDMAAGLVR